jgi:hypothetical protein
MASMHTRSGVGGLPPPKGWVFTRWGINSDMASHNSSGMLHSSTTCSRSMRVPPKGAQLPYDQRSCTKTL